MSLHEYLNIHKMNLINWKYSHSRYFHDVDTVTELSGIICKIWIYSS